MYPVVSFIINTKFITIKIEYHDTILIKKKVISDCLGVSYELKLC